MREKLAAGILSINDWVIQEFSSAKLKDFRLTKRFKAVLGRIFSSNGKGTGCHQDEPFAKGIYRFLKNKRVEVCELFAPHVESTIDRLPQDSFILNIQDTSGLNYHKHQSKIDIGHIGSSPNRPDSFGYWLHTGLLCDSKGSPLGLSYQEIWSRLEWNKEDKNTRKSRTRRLPIEDKESFRWLEGVDACEDYRKKSSSKIVHVCDREADIYELFQKCQSVGDSFLIRAKSDRRILVNGKQTTIKEALKDKKAILKDQVEVIGNSEREAKILKISVSYESGTLLPPVSNRTLETSKNLEAIPVTVINVKSKQKIDGKPVNWILITNLKIKDKVFLRQIVEWYILRWRIEVFFKILKSGTKIESVRLIDINRLSKYVVMLSIKALRILQLTFFARQYPNRPITEILSDDEWNIVKKLLFPGKGRPVKKAGDVILHIAQFGGFLKGKNRRPGVLTIWEGWGRLSLIISGAKSLGMT